MPLRSVRPPVAFLVSAALALGCTLPLAAQASRLPHAREDVRSLADTLLARHPKLRLVDFRSRFQRLTQVLLRGIDTLPRSQAIMRIARLLASLEDGHTQVGLWWDPAVGFRRYPLRVYLFEDGVYVIRATATSRRLLGGRLLRIGPVPIDSVIARMRPYLHGDNQMARKDILATRLVLHEALQSVGAARDAGTTFVVSDAGGRLDSLALAPSNDQTTPPLRVQDSTSAAPLYLRQSGDTYWFTPASDGASMYAQINAMQSDSGYSFGQFCDSLFRSVERSQTRRLILDLRLNNGGDNSLDDTLVHRLIRATTVDRPGGFYLIVGRKTFSAAVNLTAELRRHTAVTLVGEPTGAPANHYGETATYTLPHSGIRILYSTQYWQSGDPRDTADAIVPSIGAPLTFEDFRNNRDPSLTVILARPLPTEP